MTQPKFAPIPIEDEVRPVQHLDVARPWVVHRPGELSRSNRLGQRGSGTQGSDQGYALHLAARFDDQLHLSAGEHREDVIIGAVAIALRRAARFGRAPVLADIELALVIFGYFDDAPEELIAVRKTLFAGVAHDDWRQRELAASVNDEVLALSPSAAGAGLAEWRSFFQL